jgi:hypothetical protein
MLRYDVMYFKRFVDFVFRTLDGCTKTFWQLLLFEKLHKSVAQLIGGVEEQLEKLR